MNMVRMIRFVVITCFVLPALFNSHLLAHSSDNVRGDRNFYMEIIYFKHRASGGWVSTYYDKDFIPSHALYKQTDKTTVDRGLYSSGIPWRDDVTVYHVVSKTGKDQVTRVSRLTLALTLFYKNGWQKSSAEIELALSDLDIISYWDVPDNRRELYPPYVVPSLQLGKENEGKVERLFHKMVDPFKRFSEISHTLHQINDLAVDIRFISQDNRKVSFSYRGLEAFQRLNLKPFGIFAKASGVFAKENALTRRIEIIRNLVCSHLLRKSPEDGFSVIFD